MGGPEVLEICDTWVALSAAALGTERIRLGTLLTPLPRYRPYEVAMRAASLDRLCDGRLTLTVGAGSRVSFDKLGEDARGRVRIAKLKESLDIVGTLWAGEVVDYEAEHFAASGLQLTPSPAESPPDLVAPFADTGVGSWTEPAWVYRSFQYDPVALRERVRKGPPVH